MELIFKDANYRYRVVSLSEMTEIWDRTKPANRYRDRESTLGAAGFICFPLYDGTIVATYGNDPEGFTKYAECLGLTREYVN